MLNVHFGAQTRNQTSFATQKPSRQQKSKIVFGAVIPEALETTAKGVILSPKGAKRIMSMLVEAFEKPDTRQGHVKDAVDTLAQTAHATGWAKRTAAGFRNLSIEHQNEQLATQATEIETNGAAKLAGDLVSRAITALQDLSHVGKGNFMPANLASHNDDAMHSVLISNEHGKKMWKGTGFNQQDLAYCTEAAYLNPFKQAE